METLSYTTFRNHLAGILDKINDDHEPVLITRQNGKPAVVMSLEYFQSYEETAYLHNEVVNDALRKAREMESGIEAIRRRLMAAESSGFTDMTMDEIWEEARRDGQVSP